MQAPGRGIETIEYLWAGDYIEHHDLLAEAHNLPDHFDWRDVGGTNHVRPVRNQLQAGKSSSKRRKSITSRLRFLLPVLGNINNRVNDLDSLAWTHSAHPRADGIHAVFAQQHRMQRRRLFDGFQRRYDTRCCRGALLAI